MTLERNGRGQKWEEAKVQSGRKNFLISWTLSSAFTQGWLVAPLTFLLPALVGRSFPRDSNPGWGDWRRSLLVWRVCCGFLWVFFEQFFIQCALLVTGLG